VGNDARRRAPDQARLVIGGLFIAVGIVWAIAMVLPGFLDIGVIGPLALIGFGAVLAASGVER